MNDFIKIENLVKKFPLQKTWFFSGKKEVHAVQGVSFSIRRGETLGLVGESGCGKSTLGRCILRLLEPTEGKIWFDGIDVLGLNPKELRKLRRRMQIVFQDPYASLNPRMKIGEILEEPIQIHRLAKDKNTKKKKVLRLLDLVGLRAESVDRYPHEFSGGQRQRICIARALAVEPEFIVCDEPISALDVSIQAQIINLLQDLQKELKLTYLFVAHDLKVVRHIADRIAVMYLGKVVEMALSEDLFKNPRHPYTQALLSAIPIAHPERALERQKKRILLTGDVPSPVSPPTGCHFHPRCSIAQQNCKLDAPQLSSLDANHEAACHYPLNKNSL